MDDISFILQVGQVSGLSKMESVPADNPCTTSLMNNKELKL